jgi:TonB family protein
VKIRRCFVLAALGASLLIAPGAARADLSERWAEKLGEAERLLVEGDYAKARKITVKVTEQMVDAMGPGAQAEKALGAVLTLRSLAEAGLGHEADALWYWHVALNLFPEVAGYDLDRYGAPGKLLRDHPLGARSPSVGCVDIERTCDAAGHEVTPPKVRRKPRPEYPLASLATHQEGSLEVMVAVSTDGTVSHPRILKALPSPTMSLAVLEAVREWEFEPARANGEPVAFYYHLTTNFEVRER